MDIKELKEKLELTQFCGDKGDFLRPHHKMAKKLTLYRVFRHKSELREYKLFLLCNIM